MIDLSSLAIGFVLGALSVAQAFTLRELGEKKRTKRAPRTAPMPAQMSLGIEEEPEPEVRPRGPRPVPIRTKAPTMREYLAGLESKERLPEIVKGGS